MRLVVATGGGPDEVMVVNSIFRFTGEQYRESGVSSSAEALSEGSATPG